MREVGARLAEARGRITIQEFADELGFHANTLGRYERGERMPTTDFLNALAAKGDVNPMWVLDGQEPRSYRQARGDEPDASWKKRGAYPSGGTPHPLSAREPAPDLVYVKQYDIEVGGGRGRLPDEPANVIAVRGFSRAWLWNEFGATEQDVFVVTHRGDSMSSLINDRDIILVDRRDTSVSRDDIYVIRMDDVLYAKNVQRLPGGWLKIWSESERVSPPFTVNLNEPTQRLEVIGRVLWRGGKLRR